MLTKDAIIKLLETDDRAVARALVVLTARQTDDEKAQENTRYLNGRGYRPCHARMGTSMSTFFERRGYLSPKQIAYWRVREKTGTMRIANYAGQLLEEAQLKAATKAKATAAERERLEYELGMVMDSDDPVMIGAAQSDLDAFILRVRGEQA